MRWRAGLVSLGVWALIVPASAGAATGGSATMSSEAGDYIGGGRQQIFDAQAGDRVVGSLSSDGAALGVSVSGGTYGASYNMTFVAPDGAAAARRVRRRPARTVPGGGAPWHRRLRRRARV